MNAFVRNVATAIYLLFQINIVDAALPSNLLPSLDNLVMLNKMCPLTDPKCIQTEAAYENMMMSGYCLSDLNNAGNVNSWSVCQGAVPLQGSQQNLSTTAPTSQTVLSSPYPQDDVVVISSKYEINLSAGLRTSCYEIARETSTRYDGLLSTNSNDPSGDHLDLTKINTNATIYRVSILNWRHEYVDQLFGLISNCAALAKFKSSRGTNDINGIVMSPKEAVRLLQMVDNLAASNREYSDAQIKLQKVVAENAKKQGLIDGASKQQQEVEDTRRETNSRFLKALPKGTIAASAIEMEKDYILDPISAAKKYEKHPILIDGEIEKVSIIPAAGSMPSFAAVELKVRNSFDISLAVPDTNVASILKPKMNIIAYCHTFFFVARPNLMECTVEHRSNQVNTQNDLDPKSEQFIYVKGPKVTCADVNKMGISGPDSLTPYVIYPRIFDQVGVPYRFRPPIMSYVSEICESTAKSAEEDELLVRVVTNNPGSSRSVHAVWAYLRG